MTRKLLMNNYVKNGLMPVTDGLIGWYDARYRNSDDTYLIDRSNNGNDISCKYSGRYVVNNDSIDLQSPGYTEGIDYTKYINGEVTILYCNKILNNGRLMCMSGFYLNNFGWWIIGSSYQSNVWYKGTKYIDDHDNRTIIPIGKNMIGLSISPTKIKMYLNGNLIYEKTISINMKELRLALFGINVYGNGTSYKYYSSYVYNRALTDEEIMQNYQYEQSIQRGE